MSKCLKGCLIFHGKCYVIIFYEVDLCLFCAWTSSRSPAYARIAYKMIFLYRIKKESTHTAYRIRLNCILFEVNATNQCVAIYPQKTTSHTQYSVRKKERRYKNKKKKHVHRFEWWCLWAIAFIFKVLCVVYTPKDMFLLMFDAVIIVVVVVDKDIAASPSRSTTYKIKKSAILSKIFVLKQADNPL